MMISERARVKERESPLEEGGGTLDLFVLGKMVFLC